MYSQDKAITHYLKAFGKRALVIGDSDIYLGPFYLFSGPISAVLL